MKLKKFISVLILGALIFNCSIPTFAKAVTYTSFASVRADDDHHYATEGISGKVSITKGFTIGKNSGHKYAKVYYSNRVATRAKVYVFDSAGGELNSFYVSGNDYDSRVIDCSPGSYYEVYIESTNTSLNLNGQLSVRSSTTRPTS